MASAEDKLVKLLQTPSRVAKDLAHKEAVLRDRVETKIAQTTSTIKRKLSPPKATKVSLKEDKVGRKAKHREKKAKEHEKKGK